MLFIESSLVKVTMETPGKIFKSAFSEKMETPGTSWFLKKLAMETPGQVLNELLVRKWRQLVNLRSFSSS